MIYKRGQKVRLREPVSQFYSDCSGSTLTVVMQGSTEKGTPHVRVLFPNGEYHAFLEAEIEVINDL